jgi:uncharacterized iron-regulated protein
VNDLLAARAIYIGEDHNNDFHHEFQLELIRALHRRNPRLLIGMEMFQTPFQPVLDGYVGGVLDEATLLSETEYFSRWGWDYAWYRPILAYAREHRIPVIALNAPREATRRVSSGGGLDALSPEDRPFVAEQVDLGIESHRKWFEKSLRHHPMGPNFDLDAFYASQCLWDATMAQTAARALEVHHAHRIVVIAGNGHCRKDGIPLRASRRGATPSVVLLGQVGAPDEATAVKSRFDDDPADFHYYTRPPRRTPPTPNPGVNLDPAGEGAVVANVARGGIADLAGVMQGDRIVELAGRAVSSTTDLRIALALMEGRMGEIVVLREDERRRLRFDRAWSRR